MKKCVYKTANEILKLTARAVFVNNFSVPCMSILKSECSVHRILAAA